MFGDDDDLKPPSAQEVGTHPPVAHPTTKPREVIYMGTYLGTQMLQNRNLLDVVTATGGSNPNIVIISKCLGSTHVKPRHGPPPRRSRPLPLIDSTRLTPFGTRL